MSTFEYLAVLISVIVGLAITHLLGGLARLLSHPSRYKIDWIHLVWVGNFFATVAFFWWYSLWLNTVEQWTAPLYSFLVLHSTLYFLICAVLMPSDFPDDGDFWRYFVLRRRLFFGLLIASIVLTWIDQFFKGHPLMSPWAMVITLALYSPGLFTVNRKYHGAIALWSFFWALFFLLNPGFWGDYMRAY
jgi:hypothetical protein